MIGRERKSKSWMASAVPSKGLVQGNFSIDKCLDFIEENGDKQGDIIIKTDQAPSIECLVSGIRELRSEGRTVVEEAAKKWGPAGNSGQNGIVERGVQEMEGRIRALYLGLEERLGFKVDARERIISFIPEYGAYLMNRLKQGEDGKVAYERIKGNTPSVVGVEMLAKRSYTKWE